MAMQPLGQGDELGPELAAAAYRAHQVAGRQQGVGDEGARRAYILGVSPARRSRKRERSCITRDPRAVLPFWSSRLVT